MKTAFCINCGKNTEYWVNAEDVEITTPKGKTLCRELSACCDECGKEMYVPELNDRNVEFREAAYNKL